MRPKLKGDTLFTPVDDGVIFRNNQGSLKLKGKTISRWVERLAPYLNGDHTLAELTAGLDAEREAMVTNLVNTLSARGFVRDISQDLPHHLSPSEQETYAAELAFIDAYCDSAASRFERFREQQVLLIGSGFSLTGLVHACLKSGLRQLAAMITAECETPTHRHQASLDLFHKGDPRQTLREIDVPQWEHEEQVLSTLQPFDTIIHVSDLPMLARASLLNRLCVTQKKNLLQAILIEDHAWIGPLLRPEVQGCWECAWRRLQGNLTNLSEQFPAYAFTDQTYGASPQATAVSRFLAPPTATIVANHLSFEVFKALTEVGPVETRGHLIEVDLSTSHTQKHPFLPHPLCQTCLHPAPRTQAQFLETIGHLEQGEPLDPDLFTKRVAPCIETRLGLFRSLEETLRPPVSAMQAAVSNPVPEVYQKNLPALLGIGARLWTARREGARLACEVYAACAVDRRRFFSEQMVAEGRDELLPLRVIPRERFLSTVPLSEAREWTWAVDLLTRRACLVPVALIYPVLHNFDPVSEARLGVGSGMSWAEAVSRGLLDVCHTLTITQIATAQQPYPQVDLAAIDLKPEGTRQRHFFLRMHRSSVTVYNVTGPLQVPTFVLCIQGKTLVSTTHVDAAQALRDGLDQVAMYQPAFGEPIDLSHLPAGPDLPVSLRGQKTTLPAYEAPQEWPKRQIWLQKALASQGWQAFAVPLDHDPLLSQIQPYIVRVLVARTENL
jgi:putative thiazole-containing bacteriocin maturation protein